VTRAVREALEKISFVPRCLVASGRIGLCEFCAGQPANHHHAVYAHICEIGLRQHLSIGHFYPWVGRADIARHAASPAFSGRYVFVILRGGAKAIFALRCTRGFAKEIGGGGSCFGVIPLVP